MSALADGTPPVAARRSTPWAPTAPAVAALVTAAASSFVRWPADDARPGRLALAVLAAVVVAGALLLAAGRRVARAAQAAAWVSGVALLGALRPGAGAIGDLVRGGPDDAPGPVVLLAAVALALVAGVRAHRDDRRWYEPVVGPPPGRAGTVALVSAAVALSLAAGAVGFAAAGDVEDDSADDPLARQEVMDRAELLAGATSIGRFRVTGVARGGPVDAAGPYVLLRGADDQTVVDARTAEQVWRVPLPWTSAAATWSGDAFVAASDGAVTLFEAATGAVRWRRDDLGALDVGGPPEGPIVLTGGDDARVLVLDPATGVTARELRPGPCAGERDLVRGPVVVVTCAVADERWSVEVFGAAGPTPTWRGAASVEHPVVGVAPGVVLAVPGRPETFAATDVLVDAESGAELRAVPAGARVASTRGRVLAVVHPDGTVERWDADTRTTVGSTVVDGGDEYDAHPGGGTGWRVVGTGWRLVGDRLVAARPDGFGSAVSPASERRYGVVAWDLTTGARVERTVTGSLLGREERAFSAGPLLTDDVVVLAVGLRVPQELTPKYHGLLVTLGS